MDQKKSINVLSLDGGGTLGVYTIGVLKALKDDLDQELHSVFSLIYGTSTGSIIGSMISLEITIDDIFNEYMDLAPKIMSPILSRNKSQKLKERAEYIFQDKRFENFGDKYVGIVTVDQELNRQRIFKSYPSQDFGTENRKFHPGFGAKIADAVVGSCAAYPVFEKHVANIEGGACTLLDGGYVANDPSLFALTDAVHALKYSIEDITMLSVGVGSYAPSIFSKVKRLADPFGLMDIVFETNRNGYTESLIPHLFQKVLRFRIDHNYTAHKTLRASFVESNKKTLNLIYELGKESYNQYSKKEQLKQKLMDS